LRLGCVPLRELINYHLLLLSSFLLLFLFLFLLLLLFGLLFLDGLEGPGLLVLGSRGALGRRDLLEHALGGPKVRSGIHQVRVVFDRLGYPFRCRSRRGYGVFDREVDARPEDI